MSTLALGAHTLVATAIGPRGERGCRRAPFPSRRRAGHRDQCARRARRSRRRSTPQQRLHGARGAGNLRESIDFRGKAITVESEQGPGTTIIDASGRRIGRDIQVGETRAAVLERVHDPRRRRQLPAAASTIAVLVADDPRQRRHREPLVHGRRHLQQLRLAADRGQPDQQERDRRLHRRLGIGVYVGGNSAAEIHRQRDHRQHRRAASGGGLALFAAGNAVVGNVIARNVTERRGRLRVGRRRGHRQLRRRRRS